MWNFIYVLLLLSFAAMAAAGVVTAEDKNELFYYSAVTALALLGTLIILRYWYRHH